MLLRLSTGAEARLTGLVDGRVVVCANGGTSREVQGTWSASVEWLVRRLAPAFPQLAFLELRYRVKSWRRFDDCVADGAAALDEARARGAQEVALLGFSMGGAVAVRIAGDDTVSTVIGLAPWLPPQLELDPLRGRRLAVVHGTLDSPFPGVPGVRPSMSLEAADRARAAGAEVERIVIPGAVHAIALRSPRGGLVAMPRARRWAELVAGELERFCA
jgi:alpha-beta hydrolase superfamily lysophospholipase